MNREALLKTISKTCYTQNFFYENNPSEVLQLFQRKYAPRSKIDYKNLLD